MLTITPTPTPEEAAAIAAALAVLDAERQEPAEVKPQPSRWPHADSGLRQPSRPHAWGDWWR